MATMVPMEGVGDGAAHPARPPLAAIGVHYCSAGQAARELGVSSRRVRALAALGELEGQVVEGRWLVSRAAVAQLRAAREQRSHTRYRRIS
jgi:hypothetical protein